MTKPSSGRSGLVTRLSPPGFARGAAPPQNGRVAKTGLTAPFGFLRVAAACPPVSVADPRKNADHVLRFVDDARKQGVQVLVFPELGLTGYTCGDLFFSLTTLIGGAERALERILAATANDAMLIAVGLPACHEGRLFNVAAVLQKGRILGVVPKTYLPGYKEYYEERWFASARDVLSAEILLAGQEAPLGTNLLFTVDGRAGGDDRGRDLRGPLGPHPAQQPSRGGGGDGAPEPLRVQRAGGQGGVPPRAGQGAVRADAVRLRLREHRRARVHDRRGVRRPAAGRGERDPHRGGHALLPRRAT